MDFAVKKVAIQKPQRKLKDAPFNSISKEQLERLENRRAGIEPIISHLKKYFQSSTFLDLSRRTPQKRVSEYLATIGTLIAAVVATGFEIFGRHKAAEAAVQGMFLIALGVAVYVLRDRMKDWLRNFLSEKARKFYPIRATTLGQQ